MNKILFVTYDIRGKRGVVTALNLRARNNNIGDSIKLKIYMRPSKAEILKIKLYTWGEIKLTKDADKYAYKISNPIIFRRIVSNSFIRC